MSTLFISEFADLPISSNGAIQAPNAAQWIADQTVSITADGVASDAFNTETHHIVVVADAACSIAWTPAGAEITDATTSNLLIPANTPREFGVAGGMKLSVIANS